MFLLEETTFEGVCLRIVKELEAVEDLDGATPLDPDDAAEDPGRRNGRGRRRRRFSPFRAIAGCCCRRVGDGWVHLRLNPRIVVRDVHHDQRVKLERQTTARRLRHSPIWGIMLFAFPFCFCTLLLLFLFTRNNFMISSLFNSNFQ